jgi:hypothetical protein
MRAARSRVMSGPSMCCIVILFFCLVVTVDSSMAFVSCVAWGQGAAYDGPLPAFICTKSISVYSADGLSPRVSSHENRRSLDSQRRLHSPGQRFHCG